MRAQTAELRLRFTQIMNLESELESYAEMEGWFISESGITCLYLIDLYTRHLDLRRKLSLFRGSRTVYITDKARL
jgi:hypothetical protein